MGSGGFSLADLLPSSPARRLLIFVSSHTGHLPHIPLLSVIPSSLRSGSSRPRRHDRHCEHCWTGPARSSCWLFRHLHQPRRGRFLVQQQRLKPRYASKCRSGSTQLDLGSQYLQRLDRLPIFNVSDSQRQARSERS